MMVKMLYFYMNTTDFVDPASNGGALKLGDIELSFFTKVFSKLSSAISYQVPELDVCLLLPSTYAKVPAYLFSSIDEESTHSTKDCILQKMQDAHSMKIPELGKSLTEMGLHYEFILSLPNKQVCQAKMDYLAENNIQILEESISSRNMTLPQKIDYISSELLEIGSTGNQLAIIDSYIFPCKHRPDYFDLFIGIIERSQVSSVKIITDPGKYNRCLCSRVGQTLSIPITVWGSAAFHDRWWIIECKRKGIKLGTSLNGLGGNRISGFDPTPQSDVDCLLRQIDELPMCSLASFNGIL